MGGDFFGQPTSFSPQASAGQFIVTPSMVIPEADWEAAFASPAAAAPKPLPTLAETPQVGPLLTHWQEACCLCHTFPFQQASQTKWPGSELRSGIKRIDEIGVCCLSSLLRVACLLQSSLQLNVTTSGCSKLVGNGCLMYLFECFSCFTSL